MHNSALLNQNANFANGYSGVPFP